MDQLRPPDRKARWYLLVAICIKLLALFFFAHQRAPDRVIDGQLYVLKSDAYQYVQPVENLVHYGEHRIDNGAMALRMPGYTPILLLYRLFLPIRWALNMTLITQAVLSGISCYVLALIALHLFRRRMMFHLTFWIYTLSTYVSIYDVGLVTESLAASNLIFATYWLLRAIDTGTRKSLLLSGFFMAWSVFLRPFLLPVLCLYAFALWMNHQTKPASTRLATSLLFVTPFLVADAIWIGRNWISMGEFVPLQTRVTYNDGRMFNPDRPLVASICDLNRAYGGDHTWWNPREAAYWFVHEDVEAPLHTIPDQLFSEGLTQEGLIELRNGCVALDPLTHQDSLFPRLRSELIAQLQQVHDNYRENHPLHYHVTSRLIHLKRFILHTGVYNIPFQTGDQRRWWQHAFKGVYALLYLFVMLVGNVGCLVLLFTRFDLHDPLTYLLAVPIFIILFFPFVLKMHEYRFNILAYPFLTITACFVINKGWMWFRRGKALPIKT